HHITQIIPDEVPAMPGVLRHSDARLMAHTYDLLASTAAGRLAMQQISDTGTIVTMERGVGHYRTAGPPPRINLDPADSSDPHFLAGTAAHEAHHAQTADRDVRIGEMDHDTYMRAALWNEAESQSALFEHHRELTAQTGVDRGWSNHGYAEYHNE